MCLSLLLFGGASVEANAAVPPDSGTVFWKFDTWPKSLQNSDGHIVIAGVHAGRTYILDPATMKVVPGDPSEVARQPWAMSALGISPVPLPDGGSFRVDTAGSGACGDPEFSDPPLVKYSRDDRTIAAFYVVARRTPPEVVDQLSLTAQDCTDFNGHTTITRQFGRPLGGDIFSLPDHHILLAGFYYGLIVRLPGLPSSVVSFEGNLFLIPRPIVEKALIQADYPNARRYQVFLAAIRHARNATPPKLLPIQP